MKRIENELREKIHSLERQLADSLNRENGLEQDKRDLDDKINQLHSQNQKMKDDFEDLRNQMEKVVVWFDSTIYSITIKEVQKWKTDAYTVRSEAKALETANAGLKAQLQAATDRADHLNKQVTDQTSKIRDRK